MADNGPRLTAIVASGDMLPADGRHLDGAELLIAADGGARALLDIGIRPHLLIGDLDSVEAADVARLEAAGTRIERHPEDKTQTDTELALERAVGLGARRIVILGALGGERTDHEMANLMLLADDAWRGLDIAIVRGPTLVRALRDGERLEISAAPGDLVTLLPVGGDARGVRTSGLRWQVDGETLAFGRSRGVSNVVTDASASVELDRGALLVIETAQAQSVQ